MSHDDHAHHQHGHDQHGHHHIDEADWAAMVEHVELQGELFGFVTQTAARLIELRGAGAAPVQHIIDIGSGPGVATCELAQTFPEASVLAVDSSPAMLERTAQRAAARGLQGRVNTLRTELPEGLDGCDPADVIWASMSLHHIGDEVAMLRLLANQLAPGGLLAIAEVADPTRILPDDLGVGRPGLAERLDAAGRTWFAAMRESLPSSVPSHELATMVTDAGLDVVESRVVRLRVDAPLSDDARRLAVGQLQRVRHQFAEHLDDDDAQALDVLLDADDPRGIAGRPDLFIESSSLIVIARSTS